MALVRSRDWPFAGWPDWFPRFELRVPEDAFGSEGIGMLRIEEIRDADALIVRAEMPGIDPDEDVEITVADGKLHIRAERREEKKEEKKGRIVSEFHYGSFSRTIPLPSGAGSEDVAASYKNGVLEVRVPIDEAKAASTRVPISRPDTSAASESEGESDH